MADERNRGTVKPGLASKAMLAVIRFYMVCLSPLKGTPCCRFRPTCSEYARQAVEKHGALKGGWMSLKRILRCHPFYHGPVYDPVPEADEDSGTYTNA